MEDVYDLIIVGAGPAGLSAMIYAKRAMIRTLIIEKSTYGGQIKNTSEIVNYPGFKKTSGQKLMSDFYEHAMSCNEAELVRDTVVGVEIEEGLKVVKTKKRGGYKAKAVILDLGCSPRRLEIPGEIEFTGAGVAYCATCDAAFFKNQQVYVLGSGDAGIEEAEYIAKYAERVTIIVLHEEGILDCNKASRERVLKNNKIDFIWNSTLQEIKGDHFVKSIVIKNIKTNELEEKNTDGIFLFIGSVPNTGPVSKLIELDREGYVMVDYKMETNIEGLFSAGDCNRKYVRQVITAASDGAIAAVAADRYIDQFNAHIKNKEDI